MSYAISTNRVGIVVDIDEKRKLFRAIKGPCLDDDVAICREGLIQRGPLSSIFIVLGSL